MKQSNLKGTYRIQWCIWILYSFHAFEFKTEHQINMKNMQLHIERWICMTKWGCFGKQHKDEVVANKA